MAMPGEPDYRYMYHIGIAEHRLLAKSFDSGDPAIIDVLVVDNMQACLGYAIGRLRALAAEHRPLLEMRNSIVLIQSSIGSAQPYLVSHEFGHILTDLPTHSLRLEQLMEQNPGKSGTRQHIFGNNPTRANWEDFVVVNNADVYVQQAGMPYTIALVSGGQVLDPLNLTPLGPVTATCTTHVRHSDSSVHDTVVTPAMLADPGANGLIKYSGTKLFHDPMNRTLNADSHIHTVSGDLLT